MSTSEERINLANRCEMILRSDRSALKQVKADSPAVRPASAGPAPLATPRDLHKKS